MSNAILKGNASGTGSMTLESPATNSDRTITLPDANGVAMVSGNMPAFSANSNASQSISSGVFTKVQFQTEEFDTANAFDSTTNYRFTPQVAGYYIINGAYNVGGTITGGLVSIYKNGSEYKRGVWFASNFADTTVSSVVYLNGSTDYVEIYAYITGSSILISSGSFGTWFNGVLVRTA